MHFLQLSCLVTLHFITCIFFFAVQVFRLLVLYQYLNSDHLLTTSIFCVSLHLSMCLSTCHSRLFGADVNPSQSKIETIGNNLE